MSIYGAGETVHYSEWLEANQSTLEMDFIATIPPEEQPLDDDYPDFMDNNADKFAVYCMERFDD